MEAQVLRGHLFFAADGVQLTSSHNPSSTTLHVQFVGANASSDVTGVDRQGGVVNYVQGNDPEQWHTGVPTFGSVVYHDLYPGIDLHYTGTQQQLKGTYTVAAGADPNQIHWRYAGARRVTLDPHTGDLQILLPGTTDQRFTEAAPVAWQQHGNQRVPVVVRYQLMADGSIGFLLGAYDRTEPLVIDPALEYSTFLGGNADDAGEDIAVDAAGNMYVTGFARSLDFPLRNPFQPTHGGGAIDVIVSKLAADGHTLVYSTYLGGSGDRDFATGIAVDAAGNVYVTGETSSTDFPIRNALQPTFGGGFSDAFITKLRADGQAVVFSTFLGGSGNDGSGDIAVDAAGNVYVTGQTRSTNFPTVNALQAACGSADFCRDAFVARLRADGQALTYSTYLGGNGGDNGGSIAVDTAGNVYVSGGTGSPNFPIRNALQATNGGLLDAFITKLRPDGQALVFSTFLGGGEAEFGNSLALDTAGQVHVSGYTASADFPVANAVQPTFGGGDCEAGPDFIPCTDAFAAKLTANGQALVFSTFLGGNESDVGGGIAVDPFGNVYLTGDAVSDNFPVVNAIDPTPPGNACLIPLECSDVFVAKLTADGRTLRFSTFLGGSDVEMNGNIAVDGAGTVYVTGRTHSFDFPVVNPLQAHIGGNCNGTSICGSDAFVVKISDAGQHYRIFAPVIIR
jgi:hypothetical protein